MYLSREGLLEVGGLPEGFLAGLRLEWEREWDLLSRREADARLGLLEPEEEE